MMSSHLDNKLASDADHEVPPEPSNSRCTDMFQIVRAEPWTTNTGGWCLFSSKSKLCFQIKQGSSWREDSMFPIYNIWSPPYFGISLSKPNPTQDPSPSNLKKSYKLNCNDFVLTSYEDDAASLKAGDTGSIPFERDNVVGGIDVDYPSFLQCRCCFRYRGWVTLANGERWRFDEIDESYIHGKLYYQFQRVHERVNNREFPKIYPKALQWECLRDWKSNYGEAPADVPFPLNQDTRLCRVSSKWYERHRASSKLVASVIAIMNREGLVFVNGLKEANEIETANLRELVLMTGLTVAKFERPALEK